MQATRLLQLNNPPQHNYQHLKYKVLNKNYLPYSSQANTFPKKIQTYHNKWVFNLQNKIGHLNDVEGK